MASDLSFHQRHPIVSGFFILGLLFLLFLGVFSFLLRSCASSLSTQRNFIPAGEEAIGILDIKGVIATSDQVLKDLVTLRENRRVKGIVVRIESPGGTVGASQEIFREIELAGKAKPVVASMGSIAASGGYYAALGARRIMASRGTLTGSIGVILKFPNLKELYRKIGYQSEIVKSGKLKDMGSTDRSLTEHERAILNELLDNVHQQFVGDVSRRRNLPAAEVAKLADGRIFSGEQALKSGLIDETGNFYDAVRLCARLAGMEDVKTPELYYPGRDRMELLKILTSENIGGILRLLERANPVLSSELVVEP